MGTVYLARDPVLGRTVAIKVLSATSDELVHRFAREARAAAALRHPNIVTIYDIGEENGRPYIAMEFLDGETVAEIVRRRAPLSIRRKVQLMTEVCAGLGYAHRSGLVHRDVKPSNLIVTSEGVLKILDFGLARLGHDSSITATGALMGTPQYMSPEQIKGSAVDARSDIFSAGLVFYELLSYRRAYAGDSPVEILHKVLSGPPPPLREIVPDLDSDLEAIVARAIEPDPAARYSTLDEMSARLGRAGTRLDAFDDPPALLPQDGPPKSGAPPTVVNRRPREEIAARRKARLDRLVADASGRFDAGDYDRCAELLEEALLLDPVEPRAVDLLDRVRRATEERDATRLVDEARHLLTHDDVDGAHELLARAETLHQDLPAVGTLKAEVEARRDEIQRQLEREHAAQTAIARAKRLVEDGALQAASRSAAEALAFDPKNTDAQALVRTIAGLMQQEEAARNVAQASETTERQGEGAQTARDGGAARVAPMAPGSTQRDAPEGPAPSTIFVPPPPIGAHGGAAGNDGTVILPPSSAIPGYAGGRPDAVLVISQSVDPALANRTIAIDRDTFEIGREGANLQSSDLGWSRRHAVIEYRDRGYNIRDLGSKSGTYVNGRTVRTDVREPLFFGARISIGQTVMTFAAASDTRLPDLTGADVDNRYVLVRLIRGSAKGAVYAARQRNGPVHVALKLLSPALLAYPGYRERFSREADVASQLLHPHICHVQDFGEADLRSVDGRSIHTVFLCLRLMTGGSLADRLADDQPIALREVAAWVSKLADALGYAHRHGVIHGDLKPTAVVFDHSESGQPYLTDFAIGHPHEGDSRPGVIGTPAFMAPEQWEGASAAPEVDQFGLAALAYYMVARAVPFEGQDHPRMRRQNFDRGPVPAHEEAALNGRPNVSPIVSDVLARALSRAPADRYPSVADFASTFADAVEGRGDDRARARPRVFLSYQRSTGAILTLYLASQLQEKHEIDVFYDVSQVDRAARFPDRLAREVQRCDIFVCLLGESTLQSDWVRNEIQLAHAAGKPMIPVFQETYIVPDLESLDDQSVKVLLSYDAVRVLDHQGLYMPAAMADLAHRIKNTLGRPDRS